MAMNKAEIMAGLKAEAARAGLKLHDETGEGFKGEIESIKIKWFLGQKKAVYRMSIVLSEADHVAKFREMVKEVSSGLLPPTMTVETTTTSGWTRSGSKTEATAGAGGGTIEFAKVREAIQKAVAAGGWQFQLEGGRMP
jgi:hypothetical protein